MGIPSAARVQRRGSLLRRSRAYQLYCLRRLVLAALFSFYCELESCFYRALSKEKNYKILLPIGLLLASLFFSFAQGARLPSPLLLLDVASAGRHLIAVGERGVILRSQDGGKQWMAAPSPARATLTSVFFYDEHLGWASGHDGVIVTTKDGGQTWRQLRYVPNEKKPLLDIWFQNAKQGYAVGAYGTVLTTQDAGNNWSPIALANEDRHINAIAGTASGTVLLAGEAGLLYVRHAQNPKWEALPTPYTGSFFGALITSQGSFVIFGLRGKVFRSDDEGKSWRMLSVANTPSLMGGAILEGGTIAMVGLDGTLILNDASGEQMQTFTLPAKSALSSIVSTTPRSAVTVGEAGVTRIVLPALLP